MRSLREAIAKMKGDPMRCVEKDCHPVAMVTFCPWQAKEWALPWSRLDALSVGDEEESERVELFFPHHHVIMIGDNLRDMLDEIRTFEVLFLRNLPASHRPTFTPRETFITQLEVRALADPKNGPPVGVPF